MDQLIEINTLDEYKEAIKNKSIILFTASWCPDCMFIKPFIGDVVKKHPDFTFYSINRDNFIELCQNLDILGIPSFVSYENGQETGRFVSKLRKTQEEIEAFIQSIN
nr:thioredoxin family protein [uncultured Faecalibacillus sp.]